MPWAGMVRTVDAEESQRHCLTHHRETLNYERRSMVWGGFCGAFSSFIIHPSTLLSLLRLTADSPDLLAIIKQEGKVLNLTRRREAA